MGILRGVVQSDSGLPRARVPGHGSNPPPPIIGPSGNAKLDAVTDVVNRTFEPFRTAPDPQRGVCGVIQHYVGGAMGIIGAPFELLDTGFAMLTAPLAALMPAFPAATLLMPHLGPPHAHVHPPSLIPPAPPVPLPSIGMVMLPGCVSVLHGGVPAARAGDIGMAFTCGSIAPGLDIYTGSSNTFIGGSRAARIFDITRHCNPLSGASAFNKAIAGMGVALGVVGAGAQLSAGNALGAAMAAAQAAADAAAMAMRALLGKDPGVAPGYGVVMMGCPLVMIGGFPMPDLLEMIGGLLKAISKGLKKLRDLQRQSKFWQRLSNNSRRRASAAMRRVGVPRNVRRAVARALCFATGHPVDVVTGGVFTSMVDLRVAGPMPLVFERDWYAGEDYRGGLGHGWHHSFDLALCEQDGGVAVRLADGRGVSFLSLAPGKSQYDRKERLTLLRERGVGYVLRTVDGKRYCFGHSIEGQVMPLQYVADPVGQKIHLRYDERGRLGSIIDAAGRRFLLQYGPRETDSDILGIYGPHPDDPARTVKFVGYAYSSAGDLVAVEDALGHITRYEYAGHLLVCETDRNGLSFRFEYVAGPHGPRCVRTWGDQGVFDHKLAYDDEAKTTTVTNSLGHQTVYERGDNGLATVIIDPLGGRRSHTYNPFAQPILSVDELGTMVYREYDWRGNISKIVDVDGAVMQMAYDDRDRLRRAVDPNGCWIQWDYDEQDRTIRRNGGDGALREFAYAGPYLIGTRDAIGNQFELGYDAHGNISDIRAPSGTRTHWRFDSLGRPIEITDPAGKVERRRYDLRGRLVEQVQADGNYLSYGYDAVGRNTRVTQAKREILLGYTGTGRLAWRREQDAALRFEYDTEDQLTAVINQAGEAWRFERDPAGHVVAEQAFDGVRRSYGLDAGGRMVELRRASGQVVKVKRDGAGRLLEIEHHDGGRERYRYRADGQLLEAHNGSCAVRFERDALGRVVCEWQGEHWVAAQLDRAGQRVRVRSSLGADIHVDRDHQGLASALRVCSAGDPQHELWSARFKRDGMGRELERALPGGVLSRWTHDPFGRQRQHHVWDGKRVIRDVHYGWEPDARLGELVDGEHGRSVFGHDSLGRLAWAQYGDGTADLRMPDAVGNLFQSRERDDRKYGPAGQLLSATTKHGTTRYVYDDDGNLISKTMPNGKVWRFRYDGAGMLAEVERPDGSVVGFAYDALGRRIEKRYDGVRTRWVWNGNVPLHEWREDYEEPGDGEPLEPLPDAIAVDSWPKPLTGHLLGHPPTGPPGELGKNPPADLITWIYDADSWAPAAKLVGDRVYSIICNHIGAPILLLDEHGAKVWSAEYDIYGQLRQVEGDVELCPIRWPGQWHDGETGLYYNRYRYYDPETGVYLRRDPVGVRGGYLPYGYVADPLSYVDPLGLATCRYSDIDDFAANSGMPFRTRAEAETAWKVYNETNGDTSRTIVIGRLADTEVGEQLGMRRLNTTGWSPTVNDAWVQGGIDRNAPFYMGSPASHDNLYNPPGSTHPTTVYHRELTQLQNAGYTPSSCGNWMLPPGMTSPPP